MYVAAHDGESLFSTWNLFSAVVVVLLFTDLNTGLRLPSVNSTSNNIVIHETQ